MRFLFVTATDLELAPLLARLTPATQSSERLRGFTHASHQVDVLTTGVGMIATATWCSRVLARQPVRPRGESRRLRQLHPAYPPGTVVHVTTDCIAELGAEDDEQFLTVQQLGLLGADEPPFSGGRLVNRDAAPNRVIAALPPVTRHHREHRARQRARRLPRVVERSRLTSRAWRARRSCTPACVRAHASLRCAPSPTWWRSAIAQPGSSQRPSAALNDTALRLIEHA